MADDTGSLNVGQRLTRIERTLDLLAARFDDVAHRTVITDLDQRVKVLERIGDKYVPDPAEMLQRRQEWAAMQRGLDRLQALEGYKRWIWPLVLGFVAQYVGIAIALYESLRR